MNVVANELTAKMDRLHLLSRFAYQLREDLRAVEALLRSEQQQLGEITQQYAAERGCIRLI